MKRSKRGKGRARIDIKVFYPEAPEDRQELQKRTAQLHAEAVISRIRRLSCSAQEKRALLKAIQREAEKKL